MAKPIIIIAPGSFSAASEYDAIIANLNASGYESYAYSLPTTRKSPSDNLPGSTLQEDAIFFNGVCQALCDQASNVVILGHSYGGMVISEAVKGLTEKRVGKGRVVGMVYLTAAATEVGGSIGKAMEHLGFDFIATEGDFMYHEPLENSAKTNFSDLPLEKGIEAAKRFTYHSAASFGNALQYAGYKDAENVAYLFCEHDKTLPPDFQQSTIDRINASRSPEKPVKVYKLPTGHCPNASKPVEVARAIVEAVQAFQ